MALAAKVQHAHPEQGFGDRAGSLREAQRASATRFEDGSRVRNYAYRKVRCSQLRGSHSRAAFFQRFCRK